MKTFVCGSNAAGQFGVGNTTDTSIPLQIPIHDDIVSLDAGANHTVVITRHSIQVAGSSSRGQIGIESSTELYHFQTLDTSRIPRNESIIKVFCGWETTFLVSQTNQVYGVGCNRYGQLGLDFSIKSSNLIQKIPLQCPIMKVSSGVRHTVFLADDGAVYSCGSNRYGELGRSIEKKAVSNPLQKIALSFLVKDIAVGMNSTCLLSTDGRVYVLGRNRYGELGILPSLLSFSFEPISVSFDIPILKIASGWSTIGVVDANGTAWVWGRADRGQVGITPDSVQMSAPDNNQPVPCIYNCKPTVLSLPNNTGATSIVFGSEHGFVVCLDGCCYAWGWNEHGNCGVGHLEDVLQPTRISIDTQVVQVASGNGHSLFVCD